MDTQMGGSYSLGIFTAHQERSDQVDFIIHSGLMSLISVPELSDAEAESTRSLKRLSVFWEVIGPKALLMNL